MNSSYAITFLLMFVLGTSFSNIIIYSTVLISLLISTTKSKKSKSTNNNLFLASLIIYIICSLKNLGFIVWQIAPIPDTPPIKF